MYFSESTRLTLKHSPHQFLSRTEEWLAPPAGKVLLHCLVLNYSTTRIAADDKNREKFENLSAISPAPHGRRALAGLVDFLLALLVLMSIRVAINAPMVYGVMSDRKVIEAEDMNVRHGYITPTWLASSGAVVHIGTGATLSVPFPFETGTYQVRVVYRTWDDLVKVELGIGERSYDFIGFKSGRRFSDDVWEHSEVRGRNFEIRHGEEFIVHKNEGEDGHPEIDYIQFIAPNDKLYPREKRHNILRSEDFLRLVGFWDYDDLKYHLRDLIVLCPALQMLIHICFLSFVPWTPGALVAGIRIVRRKGQRIPGVFRGALRVLGYVLSVVPFAGVGLLWPLIVNKSENWADALSKTRIITAGAE